MIGVFYMKNVDLCEYVVCLCVYNYLCDFMLFKKIEGILLFWRIMKIEEIVIFRLKGFN